MDHILLEIHMGLEIKGELPDKMHYTSLTTKCLNNGLHFLPNPEAMGSSYGYFHKPCGSWGSLPLRILCPIKINSCRYCFCPLFLTMHRSVRLWKRDQFREHGRNGVQGEDVVGVSRFPFFFSVSPFFSSTFPSLFPSFISSLFCYLFSPTPLFLLSLLCRRMDKNRMLLRESLQ